MAADSQFKNLLPFQWRERSNNSPAPLKPQGRPRRFAAARATAFAASFVVGSVSSCGLPPIPNESDLMLAAPAALRAQLQTGDQRRAATDPAGSTRQVEELSRFYLRRSDRLAWSGPRGPLTQADQLVQALVELEADALNPEAYGVRAIAANISLIRGTEGMPSADLDRLVELDLQLTAAFLQSARHLLVGRVIPRNVDGDWTVNSPTGDLAGLLETALALNRVHSSLLTLRPRRPEYRRLQKTRELYLALAAKGGWPHVPQVDPFDRAPRGGVLEILRRRLSSGDDDPPPDGGLLETGLRQDLREFQERHGLHTSGRLDSATVAAMNVSVEQRIAQLEVNMERWRWLPHTLGSRYVLVRIADFELDVVEDEAVRLTMRVIVGKPYTRTPVFRSALTRLVLNPYWNIPGSIAADEIVPLIKRDPGYLERNGIQILSALDPMATMVDEADIDLETVRNGTYRLVQAPGELNPLGRMKFVLPNPFNIYLHDTPAGKLFERQSRDFSHGCIRLERSHDLAAYLLAEDEDWSRAEIERVLATGENVQIHLATRIPVFLLYWTAWVDDAGLVQFRRDIYESDKKLNRALREAGVSQFELEMAPPRSKSSF